MINTILAATSLVSLYFPNEYVNANPLPVPFGEQCLPYEYLAEGGSRLNPPEALIAERVYETPNGTFTLMASENRTNYTLLFRPHVDNPRDLTCLIEIQDSGNPVEDEDARL